jgi:ELWxxDGT repeat protein
LPASSGSTTAQALARFNGTINPGPGLGTAPVANLTYTSDGLYFSAAQGTTGPELWKTAGSVASTQLVKQINTATASSNPSAVVAVGSEGYFTADDGTDGVRLYRTAVSAASVVLPTDGNRFSAPAALTAAGGRLYFLSDSGSALWQTDGSTTTRLAGGLDVISPLTDSQGNPLPVFGSVKITGGTVTLQPGIYSQISVSGNANLTLLPGLYILAGGGLTVSGNARVSGTGLTLYNAGSNYAGGQSGGSYGGIALSGNASCDLTAPTSGAYTGILIFQARDNTTALSLSGNATLNAHGTVYAPDAQLSVSGNAELESLTLLIDGLSVSGYGAVS